MKSKIQYIENAEQKEFIGAFQKLVNKHNSFEVWQDFVTFFACELSYGADKLMAAAGEYGEVQQKRSKERQQRYQHAIRDYTSAEKEYITTLFSSTIMALEKNPDQDFLGSMYTQLELYNKGTSQFFTPYHISKMMAKMSAGNLEKELTEKGYISACDPCCGGGGMLIALVNTVREQNINYQQNILFIGQDIDPTVAKMCYIQLSLLGCAGFIAVGDSLSHPVTNPYSSECDVWFTPMYFSSVWVGRRKIEKFKRLWIKLEQEAETDRQIHTIEQQYEDFRKSGQPLLFFFSDEAS